MENVVPAFAQQVGRGFQMLAKRLMGPCRALPIGDDVAVAKEGCRLSVDDLLVA